jgi:hypothetical protein
VSGPRPDATGAWQGARRPSYELCRLAMNAFKQSKCVAHPRLKVLFGCSLPMTAKPVNSRQAIEHDAAECKP